MVSEDRLKYQREYTSLNRDIINQKQRLKYLENKKSILERNEEWRQLNKEKVALKKRENYLKNRDLILEKQHQHRKDNPELYKEKDKRKSIKRSETRIKIPRSQSSTYNLTNAERYKETWINEELILYHLQMIDDDGTVFYKYGLTKNLKQRLEKISYNVSIVKTIILDKYEATYLEYNLLKNVKKYIPIKKFKGYTECFIK